tara:strand:+ start:549 stop:1436 length:888 start_codon:yes stop_codon:yes gene_type:complete
MDTNSFTSKILLFGEYGIMLDSDALSIPFKKFFGFFSKSKDLSEDQKISNSNLDDLYAYLVEEDYLKNIMNLSKLKDDISSGLYFSSNIPIGSGLGSSAAITSSIICHYSKVKFDSINLLELKKTMSLIESKFHGQSSGFDPLASFFKKPILLRNNNAKIIDNINSKNFKIYLLDTVSVSSTAKMIEIFNYKLTQKKFKNIFQKSFIKTTNKCISNFINDNKEFKDSIIDLSLLTYNNMSEMIPEYLKDLWIRGLSSEKYYMKLCGSGGGGYFLVFDFDNNLDEYLNKFKLLKVL